MKKSNKKQTIFYDKWLVIITFSLMAFGLLMVASASMVISDRQYGYAFHYFIRQFIYMVLGVGLAWVVVRVPLKYWQKHSGYLILLSLLLLVAVLIPGIGRVVNGSRRWISLGVISLQVSEAVKFCALMYLASYLQRYQQQVQNDIIGFIKPLAILAVLSLLLLMEPDFGAVTVIAMTFLSLLFIAGVRLLPFSLLFAGVAGAMATLAITSPYRLERLTTFLNPWSMAYGSGYQLTQSLIAFGRGGFFGVGLGNSIQKLFYLPEAHTDFLFAVIGEELGLIGELMLIALFVILVVKIVQVGYRAHQSQQLFNAYLCYGSGLWIAFQAMINIGVNIGVLPTKGLTLPFISYGGSSMLINCVVIGLILRVAHELHTEAPSYRLRTYQHRQVVR